MDSHCYLFHPDPGLSLVYLSSTVEQDSEMMRLQLLGNPDLMRELQQVRVSIEIDSSHTCL